MSGETDKSSQRGFKPKNSGVRVVMHNCLCVDEAFDKVNFNKTQNLSRVKFRVTRSKKKITRSYFNLHDQRRKWQDHGGRLTTS